MSDATILLRDMAGDAADKAATKVNPSEDQLSQIDKPAQDNVWHETPSGSDIKNQVKSTFQKNKPLSGDEVKDVAANAKDAAANTNPKEVDAQGAASNVAGTLQARASDNIPDDTKEKVKETKEKAKETKEATQQKIRQYLNSK